MNINDIKFGDRIRVDLGDIPQLANSIKMLGLLQPIRLNRDNVLIVGGRRLTAMKSLGMTELTEGVHFTYDDSTNTFFLRQAELEENVRRMDMKWQEKVHSIAEIHRQRRLHSIETGEAWLQEHTGALLGMSQTNVSFAVAVSNIIKNGDAEIAKCATLRDALSLMTKRKEDEAVAALAKAAGVQATVLVATPSTVAPPDVDLFKPSETLANEIAVPSVQASSTLAQRFILGDCIEVMKGMLDASVPHIITDPPYGIDMKHLDQDQLSIAGVDLIKETHDVKGNEELFVKMIPEFFRILKPTGWCVMFCDATQFMRLHDLGIAAGFRVQRWPLIWLKTHQCANQAAGHNFTKNYEMAIVMGKKDARLISQQNTSVHASSGTEGREKYDHPFVKPVKLWQWLFAAFMTKSDSFFDPFAGEGSSILAGLEWGIVPTGCEISKPLHDRMLMHVSNQISK